MNFNLGFLCLYILFIFEHSANDSYKVPYENKHESFIMPDVSSVKLYELYEWKYPAH